MPTSAVRAIASSGTSEPSIAKRSPAARSSFARFSRASARIAFSVGGGSASGVGMGLAWVIDYLNGGYLRIVLGSFEERRMPPFDYRPAAAGSTSIRSVHMAKVWFITGTSKGFGRIWAEAALERGDQVVATARDVDTLSALVADHGDAVLALALD